MYEHKVGDDLILAGEVSVSQDGVPLGDMTGWTAISQVRTPTGALVANLDFQWLDPATRAVRLSASKAVTSGWPTGEFDIDIEFTSPAGETVSTATQSIRVVRGVSRAAA